MAKNKNKKKNVVNNGLANIVELNQSIGTNIGEIYSDASPVLLSSRPIVLNNTYKSNSFAQIAVDLPVQDAFRDGGFDIDSQSLSADELLELKDLMADKGDLTVIKDCIRWGRLFGGGCIIVDNGDKNSDVEFNIESVKDKEIEFLSADRWQCFPAGEMLLTADKFILQNIANKEEQIILDKSRVKVFTGQTQPYYIRNQLQGWGASIFEAIIPKLSQYIKANNVILELLDEAKIDILKIFGLSDILMSEGGEAAVKRRLRLFSEQKNFQSVGAMDSQDDYIQKQLSFGSLDQMIEKIMLLICSALRIPYSKVFGKGASGFSSGEDDLENYNGMVMASIREPITPILKWMLDIRCMQLFGRKIDDLVITWKPLRVLSETEQQSIDTQKINSYIQLAQMGIMTKKQVAEQLLNDKIILFKPEEIEAIDDEMTSEQMQVNDVAENSIKRPKKKLFKWF